MENNFKALGVSDAISKGLEKQGITIPTRIQSMLFGPFCEKSDIIAKSQTGTGKTLAYLVPLFMAVDTSVRGAQAIVLTPTHELASQVFKQAELLAKNSGLEIRSALIIGSANIERQIERLREKPHIIIGSAGRILDLIKRKKIPAHLVKTIVIDEGDRMLDDLNRDAVLDVVRTTLKERQIVVLSASIDENTVSRSKSIMKEDAEVIQAQEEDKLPEHIRHFYIACEWREKVIMIRKIVHGLKPEKTVVFINNPENIEVTVEKLRYHSIKAVGIYGGAHKAERKKALDDFREGRANVLVASDLGARGLDVPEITHVINLDIPEHPVYYLHRAGRCGRDGREGTVISLVTEYEKKWIRKYERAFHITFMEKEMSYGSLTDKKEKKVERINKAAPAKKIDKEEQDCTVKDKRVERAVSKKAIVRKKSLKEEIQEEGFFARKARKLAEKQKNEKK